MYKISYEFSELETMLLVGISDLAIAGKKIILTQEVANYYEFMKTKGQA